MDLSLSVENETQRKRGAPADDQSQKVMDLLPSEIALDILSRLPISSIMQFKATSYAGRDLTADPRLPPLFLHRVDDANPCLIAIDCDSALSKQLCFVDCDARLGYSAKARKLSAPRRLTFPKFTLVGSCHGMLCLAFPNYTGSLKIHTLYIYNPFVGDAIELPKPNRFMNQREVFGFGFHPKTREYKVLRIVEYDQMMTVMPDLLDQEGILTLSKSEVQVFTLGTKAWRQKSVPTYAHELKSSEALVEGCLHWVIGSILIVSFDLAAEVFGEIPTVPIPDFRLDLCEFNLSELGGCLAVAACWGTGQVDVWVMREYNVRESWTREFSIAPWVPLGLAVTNHFFPSSSSYRYVRIICPLKNGEVLLEYDGRTLVSYDPMAYRFEPLRINGLPQRRFQALSFVPTLFSAKATIEMHT